MKKDLTSMDLTRITKNVCMYNSIDKDKFTIEKQYCLFFKKPGNRPTAIALVDTPYVVDIETIGGIESFFPKLKIIEREFVCHDIDNLVKKKDCYNEKKDNYCNNSDYCEGVWFFLNNEKEKIKSIFEKKYDYYIFENNNNFVAGIKNDDSSIEISGYGRLFFPYVK